jgi:Peptidase family M3
MPALTLDALRDGGEAFMEAVSREYYLAHAGLKPGAELQPIYERYRRILGRDAIDLTRELFRSSAAESDDRRSARLLLEWQVESQSSRAVAPLDEREIAWEGSAVVRVPDGPVVPYQRVAIEIANAADRRERLALDDARAALVERELAPLRRERLQRERDFVEALEVADGYVGTFEALSGIDLGALVRECEQFLRDTQAMWDDVLPSVVRRALGVPVTEVTRADALALLRGREFDAYFPAADLEPNVRRQVREMGIDPTAGGRVVFDTAERAGKRSRAFCAPVRVPQEVYLVLRPHGGQSDYTTLLHELGHALHFGLTRPDYRFEYRWVGDNSVTESYAMLFDHLMEDRGWLLRYTALDKTTLPRFLRAAGFEELQFLRRYCAKLIYEAQLYGGEVPWSALPDLYVETLTAATTFRYRRADAFVDVDPRFYAARYLRAWQLQAVLREALSERFDEDWYRNPRAGPWMTEQLFAEGQRELAGELAERVAGRALSFAPLVRSVERLLG